VLTTEQRETVHRIFDTANAPDGTVGGLSGVVSYCGAARTGGACFPIPLNADFFSIWNATGPNLKSVLKPDGEHIVCPELGIRWLAA